MPGSPALAEQIKKDHVTRRKAKVSGSVDRHCSNWYEKIQIDRLKCFERHLKLGLKFCEVVPGETKFMSTLV